MKLLFITTLLTWTLLGTAEAQQRSYGMSVSTPSEMKAYTIIHKVSETLPLSEDQVFQLTSVTSAYWDDLKELQGQKNYEEKLAKLNARREKRMMEILKDENLCQEYQKKFDAILLEQRRGYGRR